MEPYDNVNIESLKDKERNHKQCRNKFYIRFYCFIYLEEKFTTDYLSFHILEFLKIPSWTSNCNYIDIFDQFCIQYAYVFIEVYDG